ncbi:MAG: endolytic transglycosylase MltG [Acidimicrobiales bacterium]|nr:endolytic transglycosylase MltG [Acidimicrobiales bacterium]
MPAGPTEPLPGDDDIWTASPVDGPAADVDGPWHDDDHWDDDEWDEHDDHDDHDYVDLPASGSLPKWVAVAGVLVLLLALVVGGGWVWYNRQVDPPGGPGERVTIDVPAGVTVSGIGTILEDEGVISNARIFKWWMGRKGADSFQAGQYEMRTNSDFALVLRTLEAGPTEPLLAEPAEKISVPEGLSVARILTRIAEAIPGATAEELQAELDAGSVTTYLRPADQASYEGLLFPATYEKVDGLTGAGLLQQMATEMEDRMQRHGADAARARIAQEWGLELTDYELLKVASMIQAEAGNVEEAPQIATVIYNRLSQGMPLGIDAVDRYGAELAGTSVVFNDASLPYNTRRRAGLPPTPISAPGDFAIAAALQPASGPWMYYVLESERQHVFVVTDSEFQAAKRACIERNLGCG